VRAARRADHWFLQSHERSELNQILNVSRVEVCERPFLSAVIAIYDIGGCLCTSVKYPAVYTQRSIRPTSNLAASVRYVEIQAKCTHVTADTHNHGFSDSL
jgi:hypothetical protein